MSRYVIDVQLNGDNDKIKSGGLGVENYEQAGAKFASSFHVKNAQKRVREHYRRKYIVHKSKFKLL